MRPAALGCAMGTCRCGRTLTDAAPGTGRSARAEARAQGTWNRARRFARDRGSEPGRKQALDLVEDAVDQVGGGVAAGDLQAPAVAAALAADAQAVAGRGIEAARTGGGRGAGGRVGDRRIPRIRRGSAGAGAIAPRARARRPRSAPRASDRHSPAWWRRRGAAGGGGTGFRRAQVAVEFLGQMGDGAQAIAAVAEKLA